MRRSAVLMGWVAGLLGLLGSTTASADLSAATPPRNTGTPSLPDYLPRPPDQEFTLPTIPEPTPTGPLSAGPRVFVRRVRLSGQTVFTAEELGAVAAPYENRYVTSEELQALRVALTRYYVDHGYINSGAVLPDQSVKDGVVEFRIVEGRLASIDVRGNRVLRDNYLRYRVARRAGPPLNIVRLQDSLQLLLQDSLVKRVDAQLQPGAALGESVLTTIVEERSPYVVEATFDNESAPSLGALRAKLAVGHRSLLGWGDTLMYRHERTEGQSRHVLSCDVPLNAYGTTVGAWVDTADSANVEAPFNAIDIEGRFNAHGMHVGLPLFETPGHRLIIEAAFDRRTSRTFLLGVPFSFAPGVQDGHSEVSVLRFTQDWLSRSQEYVFAARSVFNVGIDAFSPTLNASGPDGRFFFWLGQAQYAQRYGIGELILRADVQITADPLLPLEKLAIGGASTVRGYRENQLVRDQGFAASAELRIPVLRSTRLALLVELAPFADVGGAWDLAAPETGPPAIASLGLGFRAEIAKRVHLHLYWGHAFVKATDPGGDLQDDGIHFSLAASAFEW